MAPKKMPSVSEIITAINPTAKLTLVPIINLLKISRPNLSVPSKNFYVITLLVIGEVNAVLAILTSSLNPSSTYFL